MEGEYLMEEDMTLFNKFFDCVVKGVKCVCGKKLLRRNTNWYPHEGGIKIPLDTKKQWVYVTCECGHETAWNKVIGAYE